MSRNQHNVEAIRDEIIAASAELRTVAGIVQLGETQPVRSAP